MTQSPWGRFTVRGGADAEALLTALVTEIAARSQRLLPSSVCRAMVLLGGYGRGEGGVIKTNQGERPHNNLDFLIITRALPPEEQARLKTQVQEALAAVKQDYKVELDFAVISEAKLRHSPSLVMWYDMRFGHKTVLGDATLVPSLQQFDLKRIPAWDIRNLLVNRGTLLVINDQLMASRALSPDDEKLLVKHAMKAIIGYGDALLFFLGGYHWSYVEKQKRMRQKADVSPAFRAVYDQALEFRFQPDYEKYVGGGLTAWLDGLRGPLASVHLFCESKRLKRDSLTWEEYPECAFRRALLDDLFSARAWAKKIIHLLRTKETLRQGSPLARLGFRSLGPRGILPILFPVAGYQLDSPQLRELAAGYLGARGSDIPGIRAAYLRQWAKAGDTNFESVLRKWRIPLEPEDPES